MIMIDGRHGEGGGQILRTALTLSMLLGQPFEIHHIRGNRPKPGLKRQHLCCVLAAQRICGANVIGATLDSDYLQFIPGEVKAGDYCFDVGSAGSTTLVFQTILLPLLLAKKTSVVEFRGGTHNPMAPPLTFIKRSFLPLLREMGAKIDIDTDAWGFMPAGAGSWRATITPSSLHGIERLSRGELQRNVLTVYQVGLANKVAQRELASYCQDNPVVVNEQRIRQPKASCPGNLMAHDLHFEHHRVCFTQLGQTRVRAEKVASLLKQEVQYYLNSEAVLDEHLTDQMMLPMLIAGAGQFSCSKVSLHRTLHSTTNLSIIGLFTDNKLVLDEQRLSHL